MVYENTHLWAANVIKTKLLDANLRKILDLHLDQYQLGAIFPDTLSYSADSKIRNIAGNLHGENGTPTNTIVFDILDQIRDTGDEKNLAFICGYITHCAMDIVFHPMVFYLSGYSPQNSFAERAQSSYRHWHYETHIDHQFNHGYDLGRVIKPEAVDDLMVGASLKISKKIIRESLGKQMTYFKRIRSRFFFWAYRLLAALGLIEKKWIGGFYANLDSDPLRLPQPIEYRDVVTGEKQKTTLNMLMDEAVALGVRMLESAYDYYLGNIDRDACKRIISGHDLHTGRLGKTKADINFSIRG